MDVMKKEYIIMSRLFLITAKKLLCLPYHIQFKITNRWTKYYWSWRTVYDKQGGRANI